MTPRRRPSVRMSALSGRTVHATGRLDMDLPSAATHATSRRIGTHRRIADTAAKYKEGREPIAPEIGRKAGRAPERSPSCVWYSGGAGSRTPVRDRIHHSVYVRILLLSVFSCWPAGGPPLNKPSRASPSCGRRAARLARICDTLPAASGGLPEEQVQQPLRVTQPGPSYCWQL